MNRYVIVGLGIFGSAAAQALHKQGHDVVAIDRDGELVDRMAPLVTRAVVGDARDRAVLERIGAGGADAAVVSTGDDLSASALAVMALRDLGVREVVAKVVSADHARIVARVGATRTVFPERESAINLALQMTQGAALINYVRLGSGLSIQEMAVPRAWEGQTLRELDLTRAHRVSVVAVHDVLADTTTPVPDPDAPLLDTHTLVVTGDEASLARVAKIR
ncbi:potassium channel family protein [Rubrivirga marina]|uniref:Potassium transporter TrkA n=1 Tax=Rubrivirga marina TaxID=1196024 RepID=A0A271J0S9_9BACT|nr:TrkA family potassium uptake protein [Rubrivirga marina]PAP77106.1 potassium transporter TrkA [Rubrivirga marina]